MTTIENLRVSLTKHGAHKIYRILKDKEPDAVLRHTNDDDLHIHIDAAQARKNLSISGNDKVPEYWKEAKALGDDYLRALVLLAICHSHHTILEALINSKPRLGNGLVLRGQDIAGKEYTNLANNFEALGFALNHNDDGFEYDFGMCFSLEGFSQLFTPMLKDKLILVGLSSDTDTEGLIDYAIDLSLHKAMGMTAREYRQWIYENKLEFDEEVLEPFDSDQAIGDSDELIFVPGHIPRDTSHRRINTGEKAVQVSQLHNQIQNELYELLVHKFGVDSVGTEQLIGSGNRVDVVLKCSDEVTFYEIKTVPDSKLAIRQALPQLMEYAYRPNKNRADLLVVVAPAQITEDDLVYLGLLQSRFSIPISYLYYNIVNREFQATE